MNSGSVFGGTKAFQTPQARFDSVPSRHYSHPGQPLAVMVAYRRFLLGRKAQWMGQGKGHRCLRAHMKYRAYIDEYLAAKGCVSNPGGKS